MSKRKMGAALFALAWSAFVAYCVLNQWGLYAWIISLENRIFGAYEPVLTAVFLWVLPIVIVIARTVPEWMVPQEPHIDPDSDDPAVQTIEGHEIAKISKSLSVMGWGSLAGLLVTAGCVYFGLNMESQQYAKPVPFDIADLADGSVPRERVELQGIARFDAMTLIEETYDGSITIIAYLPYAAAGQIDESVGSSGKNKATSSTEMPFQVFQKVESQGSSQPAESLFDGVGYLKRAPLPVLSREFYKDAGISVAKRTYILERSTLDLQSVLFTTAAITFFILIFTLAMLIKLLLMRRRLRKTLHAQENPLG